MTDSNSYRVTSDLSEVPKLRELFVAGVVQERIAGDELEAWKLVFTELVCNAIEHGCAAPGDSVRVRWEVTGAHVELEVADPGDCHGSLEELFEREETDFSETGRGAGLILVRHFMDTIEVRPGPDGGTIIRARRNRGSDGDASGASGRGA